MDPIEGIYTTGLFLGNPIKKLKFEISFRHENLILFGNQSLNSISFIKENKENGFPASELIFFGSKSYRLPVENKLNFENGKPISRCLDCEGILGLKKNSIFWDIWPSISLSYGGIAFGDDEDSFLIDLNEEDTERFCQLERVKCLSDETGICTTEVYLTTDGTPISNVSIQSGNITNLKLRFSGDHKYIYVPEYIFDQYMEGKNVYADDISKWNPLLFWIPKSSFSSIHEKCKDRTMHINSGYIFELKPNELVTIKPNGVVEFILKSEKNMMDTIDIGIQIWNRFLLRKTTAYSNDGDLILKIHKVNDHVPITSLIMIFLVIVSLVRWHLTAMDHIFTWTTNEKIYIFFEISIFVISVISMSLKNTTTVLIPDFTMYYVINIILVGISTIGTSLFLYFYIKESRKLSKSILIEKYMSVSFKKRVFLTNLFRSFSHKQIATVALNFLFLEQRTESIACPAIAFVNWYMLYTSIYYLMAYVIFVTQRDYFSLNIRNRIIYMSVLLYTLASVATQLFFAYFYVIYPLLRRYFFIYVDLVHGIMLILIFFTFLIASLFFMLNNRRGIILTRNKYSKKQEPQPKQIGASMSHSYLKETFVDSFSLAEK